ncbi:hypothetical protein LUZ60_001395 [Juncus effusus]|nr:hypothetical protein LUZ60_001395 [Juncus effusus]
MASLSHFLTKPPPCTTTKTHVSSPCPFFTRIRKRTHIPSVSCKSSNHNHNDDQSDSLNRRDVLIGLGGLYGATNTLTSKNLAFASPIETPTKCGDPTLDAGAIPTGCCPPDIGKVEVIKFKPESGTKVRVRPPAHLVDAQYIKKFEAAMKAMRNLPPDDPRSFKQQGMIHCAYCNGTYSMLPKDMQGKMTEIQVHGSWLFFAFHRAYLHFFDKILGKLIGDPDFAMPYWNWDTAEGMKMPAYYTKENSPLFDKFRNRNHYPPTVLDLDWGGTSKNLSDADLITNNYRVMYQQMISNSKSPELFFGKSFIDKPTYPGAGSIENKPHSNVHGWVGDPNQPNGEDMGTLYSAGREPLFYAHHANVDRMWSIWKTLGSRNVDFTESDYLDSSFLLYNENAELVRIMVRDCLDTRNLGYIYKDIENLPWYDIKYSTPPIIKEDQVAKQATFPLVLDKTAKFTLQRPKEYRGRTKVQKELKEEVLSVEDILLDRKQNLKFDVYVNGYLAGSFSNLSSRNDNDEKSTQINTSLTVGLTTLLDNIGADSAETIEVKFVPRYDPNTVKVTFNSSSKIKLKLVNA